MTITSLKALAMRRIAAEKHKDFVRGQYAGPVGGMGVDSFGTEPVTPDDHGYHQPLHHPCRKCNGAHEQGTPCASTNSDHVNVETRYPWAYGFLRSAVDGVLEMLTNDQYSADFSRRVAARDPQGLAIFQRLKTAVERIDEELGKNHDLRC